MQDNRERADRETAAVRRRHPVPDLDAHVAKYRAPGLCPSTVFIHLVSRALGVSVAIVNSQGFWSSSPRSILDTQVVMLYLGAGVFSAARPVGSTVCQVVSPILILDSPVRPVPVNRARQSTGTDARARGPSASFTPLSSRRSPWRAGRNRLSLAATRQRRTAEGRPSWPRGRGARAPTPPVARGAQRRRLQVSAVPQGTVPGVALQLDAPLRTPPSRVSAETAEWIAKATAQEVLKKQALDTVAAQQSQLQDSSADLDRSRDRIKALQDEVHAERRVVFDLRRQVVTLGGSVDFHDAQPVSLSTTSSQTDPFSVDVREAVGIAVRANSAGWRRHHQRLKARYNTKEEAAEKALEAARNATNRVERVKKKLQAAESRLATLTPTPPPPPPPDHDAALTEARESLRLERAARALDAEAAAEAIAGLQERVALLVAEQRRLGRAAASPAPIPPAARPECSDASVATLPVTLTDRSTLTDADARILDLQRQLDSQAANHAIELRSVAQRSAANEKALARRLEERAAPLQPSPDREETVKALTTENSELRARCRALEEREPTVAEFERQEGRISALMTQIQDDRVARDELAQSENELTREVRRLTQTENDLTKEIHRLREAKDEQFRVMQDRMAAHVAGVMSSMALTGGHVQAAAARLQGAPVPTGAGPADEATPPAPPSQLDPVPSPPNAGHVTPTRDSPPERRDDTPPPLPRFLDVSDEDEDDLPLAQLRQRSEARKPSQGVKRPRRESGGPPSQTTPKSSRTLFRRNKLFMCPACNISFGSVAEVDQHTSKDHEEPAYVCGECDAKFKVRASFIRHCLRHTRSFSCPTCDHKCATQDELKDHSLTHSARKLKCPEPGCDAELATDRGLRRHVAAHQDVPHTCPKCASVSKNKDAFKQHVRAYHSGETIVPIVQPQ